MVKLESVIEAYLSARSNKRRSPDQVLFEMHWERNCIEICERINNHTLRPTAYTFIVDHPRPREVFASDMATRILHHYIDIRLRPHLERRLSSHTFNNRKGMGQNACQNAVISDIYEVSEGFTKDAWIIKMDLQGCFPNIRQDVAHAQLLEVIEQDYEGEDKDELIYMLSVCIFSYPTHHCFRKSPLSKWDAIAPEKSLFSKPDGIGAAIGHLIWQNAVNYYFHEFDEWVLEMGLNYERFVDDMYFVVRNKEAFLALVPEMRRRLAEMGATLHPHKFYCQHFSKGCECLGSHIKLDRIYPNKRTLRKAKQRIREFNRCPREAQLAAFQSSINSYLGICKTRNGYARAWELWRLVSAKWHKFAHFNGRTQTVEANDGYSYNQRISRKFNLIKRKTWKKKSCSRSKSNSRTSPRKSMSSTLESSRKRQKTELQTRNLSPQSSATSAEM